MSSDNDDWGAMDNEFDQREPDRLSWMEEWQEKLRMTAAALQQLADQPIGTEQPTPTEIWLFVDDIFNATADLFMVVASSPCPKPPGYIPKPKNWQSPDVAGSN